MKKITLFALAALVASGAYAAGPTVQAAFNKQGVKVMRATHMTKKAGVMTPVMANKAVDEVPAEGAETTTQAETNYYPLYTGVGTMYLGMNQQCGGYSKTFGFTPARGEVYFAPVDSAKFITSPSWTWRTYEFDEEKEDYVYSEPLTAADYILPVSVGYESQFEAPTLVETLNGKTYEYNDSCAFYLGGRTPYYWGFYAGEDEDNPKFPGLIGVTPCIFDGQSWSTVMETMIYRSGKEAESFNENGVAKSWTEEVFIDEAKNPLYTDLALNGITYKMPAQAAPYQLSGFYIWLNSVTTKAVALTANVYGYNSEGYLDRDIVIGKGVATLPAGTNSGTVRFDLKAVDDLGLTVNTPICTSEALWIEITGFNVPEVTEFAPVYNFNLTAPFEGQKDERWRSYVYQNLYPRHSVLNMTAKEVATGKETTLNVTNPFVYGNGPVHFATEFAMYFLIDYPVVMNAETGTDVFKIDLPTEGGADYVVVTASEDLPQLVNDEYLTYSVYTEDDNSDWITVELGSFEDAPGMLGVQAIAEALPAGVTGRYAIINFTGYACDFQVLVTQGEAGIASVVYNGTRAAGYYDLQGRKLNAAPAKGFYIESNGTNANVKMAR